MKAQEIVKQLESATATEATENRQFEDLIAEKTKQMEELEKTRARKEQEKAEAETLLADKTQTYDDTQAQMKADIEFFDETKSACKSKHDDWTTRSDLRTEELRGISDALEILTSDEARDLFATTIKAGKETNVDDSLDAGVSIASMLQMNQDKSSHAPPMKAYASLKDSATRSHSLRIAALAVRVREAKVGHFDEVLKSIDTMITTLKEEDASDIEKRDQCIEEYKKTNSTIANIEWLIRKNVAKIDKLERLIENLEEEKAQTIKDIDDINTEMAAMLEQRQAENGEFLNSKENDQKAITLLVDARTALSKYYKKNDIEMGPIQGSIKGLSLSQQGPDFDISADQAPEATFAGKGKRKNESKGIIQLFTMIIEDLSDEIKNSMKAEELAQLDYEKQLASAMKLNETLTERKTNLETMIGKRTQERDDENNDKTNNEGDLTAETDYRADITPDCDWIIGAFSQRASRRVAEMEGLTQAKEFLAGYSPSGSSLISEKTSPGTGLASVRFLALSH